MSLSAELLRFYYLKCVDDLRHLNAGRVEGRISYTSLLYLNIIMRTENCSAVYIAKALNITKSAVTSKINELIEQGFVERTQSQTDKRVYYLTLNPVIASELSAQDQRLARAEQAVSEKYSQLHFESLCDMLVRFNRQLTNS